MRRRSLHDRNLFSLLAITPGKMALVWDLFTGNEIACFAMSIDDYLHKKEEFTPRHLG